MCLLAGGPGRQAAAQSSTDASCTIGGTVSSGVIPLPGVAVSVSRGDRLIASTSTDDEGRWQVVVAAGSLRIGYDLRGFIPIEQAQAGDTGCAAPFSTALEVDRNPGVRIAARPATTQPAASVPTEPSPPPMVLRGRDATLNRAMLRERDAALARGEFMLSDGAWPQGLITGGPGATAAATGLALAGRAGVRGTVVTPEVQAQRAPRPPTIGAQRLYSATASYTVAGSALDSAPYQLRADTRQPKPDYFRQSVDFTIGGPLAIPGTSASSRNTTATLSYSAIRGGNLFDQYATVPTAAMREGNFSSLPSAVRDPLTGLPFEGGIIPAERVSPAAQSLLAFLPLPNGSGTSRNYHFTSTNRSTQDTMNLRLAHALVGDTQPGRGTRGNRATQAASGISATLNGQIEYRRNINDRLTPLPAIAGLGSTSNLRVPVSLNVNRRGTQQTASIAYTRNTNDTTNRYADRLNVAGHAGIAGASSDPFTWGIPSLSFATLTSVADLTPSTRTDQRLTAGYSWSRGVRTHRIRVGGDIGTSRSATRTDQNARGAFVFTGLYSGSDVADFLLGRPQQASVQVRPRHGAPCRANAQPLCTGRLAALVEPHDQRRAAV